MNEEELKMKIDIGNKIMDLIEEKPFGMVMDIFSVMLINVAKTNNIAKKEFMDVTCRYWDEMDDILKKITTNK
jgi:hypothetical protein